MNGTFVAPSTVRREHVGVRDGKIASVYGDGRRTLLLAAGRKGKRRAQRPHWVASRSTGRAPPALTLFPPNLTVVR